MLLKKKNVSNSVDISDQYHLCTDCRALNTSLQNSGWPTPSIDECLDATHDSRYFPSIDFNSGYQQIPCSTPAKSALVFSPGYGFKQWTWSVMPQGVKPASEVFQRTMIKTFKNHKHCILPLNDIIIKGRDNTRTILNDIIIKGRDNTRTILNDIIIKGRDNTRTILNDIIIKGRDNTRTILNDIIIKGRDNTRTILNDIIIKGKYNTRTILNDIIIKGRDNTRTIPNDIIIKGRDNTRTILNDIIIKGRG